MIAVPAFSQITGLAATDNGLHLYFSSSFRQRGTDQFGHPKIFRIVETGALELFVQVERRFPEDRGNTSNYYAAIAPVVSADGSRVGYVLNRECIGGSGCVFVERNRSVVLGRGIPDPIQFNGRVQLSRNGRYLLQFGGLDVFPMTSLTDLSTGVRIEHPIGNAPGRSPGNISPQAITDDGRVLIASATDGLSFWSAAGIQPVATAERAVSAIVASRGEVVIYRTERGSLRALNLRSGGETLLAEGSDPVISNDGQWLLYTAPDGAAALQQVWLIRTDGSGKRRLTDFAERIVSSTLTGDANAAFVSTESGRLLRIELPSGVARELVPRTPWLRERTGAPAAGSLNWLRGSGFEGTTTVMLDGLRVPVFSVRPDEIVYQVPFEAPRRSLRLGLEPDASPLESPPLMVPVVDFDPQFVQYGRELPPPPGADFGAVTVHDNFRALVTNSDPARPGEVVHLYMTGLGPVRPPVPSGQPAPLDRLTSPEHPLECRHFEAGRAMPVTVLFASLAPGMIGIYQVSLRLPEDLRPFDTDPTRGSVALQCGDPDGFHGTAAIPVRFGTP